MSDEMESYTLGEVATFEVRVREYLEAQCNGHADCKIPHVSFDILAKLARAGLEAAGKYDLLRRAINEYDVDGCTPKCDSYGHAENCRSGDPRAIIENQQRRIDELQIAARGVRSTPSDEGLSELEEEAELDALANEPSDGGTLRSGRASRNGGTDG